jgi:hypothetical protein
MKVSTMSDESKPELSPGGRVEEICEGEQSGDEPDEPDLDLLDEEDERPVVTLQGDREDQARLVEAEIRRLHATDAPFLFVRGGKLTRVRCPDHGTSSPQTLDTDTLRETLCRRFRFQRIESDGDTVPIKEPPNRLLDYLLARERWGVPKLHSVVTWPVYGPDWSLRTSTGYHRDAEIYTDLRDVDTEAPNNPSDEQVAEARSLLLDDLLADFPFDGEADRTNAVAMGLLPYVRHAIDGPTPLHLISAPTPGTGKTKLAKVMARIATGTEAGTISDVEGDDEWRKQITSSLLDSPAVLILDNCQVLDSSSLAEALTTTLWQDRILNKSEMKEMRVDAVWTATANNPQVSTEMARRCAPIRMVPDVANPAERDVSEFEHHPLTEWVDTHRGRLQRAFLTLVEYWREAGRPHASTSVGSFQSWANIVGGILDTCGFDGFMENRQRLREQADREAAEWRAFVEEWWDRHNVTPCSASDLVDLCDDANLLLDVIGNNGRRSKITKLGKELRDRLDRVIGEYRIVQAGENRGGANNYKLEHAPH